jgi:hypothetical protein
MTDNDDYAGIRYWAVPDRMPAPVELDPNMQDVMLRVKRGAALLDERIPGWDQRIDLDTLRIADSGQCVLGQLYTESRDVPMWVYCECESPAKYQRTYPDADPDVIVCIANYAAGRVLLGLDDAGCAENGFLDLTTGLGRRKQYDRLDEAWAQLIRERREATR